MSTVSGIRDARVFIVDIDGTLVDDKPWSEYPASELVWGNPIFGVLRDVMVEDGRDFAESKKIIEDHADKLVYWDYPDFIADFGLPVEKCYELLRAWHISHLSVYDDAVAAVKHLKKKSRTLCIVSNNPIVGCLMKVERAGLANIHGSEYFSRILGANNLRGQKSNKALWLRAVAQIGINPKYIVTIGDNPVEDGDNPLSAGIGHAVIIRRGQKEEVIEQGQKIYVRDIRAYIEVCIR